MIAESDHYSKINQLTEMVKITKEYLAQMKERYIWRHDSMQSKVKYLSAEYKKNKQQLDRSDTWQSLLQLEEKIRRQGQMKMFFKAKEQQTNYEGDKYACLGIMNEILHNTADEFILL